MIWDIMYELPLFGEWRVVRAADALLEVTHREHPRVLVRDRLTGS